MRRLAYAFVSLTGFWVCASAASCFSDSAAGGGSGAAMPGPTTCAIADGGAPPPVAPNGYYTNGSQVCTSSGQSHVFQGVDRDTFEFDPEGDMISLSDFQAIASWHANVVRIALNQDYWLSGATLYASDYQSNIQQAVTWAEQAGLEVILDLHWSDRGDLGVTQAGGTFPGTSTYVPADTAGYSVQQPMADINSVEFWKEVATVFAGDGHVFFELYNEPNGISWSAWLNGGVVNVSGTFTAVGMQQLYDTVRSTGANNLVVIGGLNFAFDLSGVVNYPVKGYNIVYATHPYSSKGTPASWTGYFGYLTINNIAPVIATEFGDTSTNCSGTFDQELISYAAQSNTHMSWTAWAWFPDGCSYPALISDWNYDPTVQGQVVEQALMANNPLPVPLVDAGGPPAADAALTDGSIADATLADAAGGDGSSGSLADATVTDGSGSDAATSSADDASNESAGE